MFCGAVLALCLCDAAKVQRADGSHVILMKNPTWKSELLGLWETLHTDTYIVLLFPMFFASNWFYTYQFNDINSAYFDVRTRALNNTLYWSSQIVGAFVFGHCLDLDIRRTVKAKAALVTLFVLTMVIWGGGYAWQRRYTRASVGKESDFVRWDWDTRGYVGPMFLYMFYGFYDAAWQTSIYWYVAHLIPGLLLDLQLSPPPSSVLPDRSRPPALTPVARFMGALSNSGRKTANFAGFYKGIQSAGASVMYRMDSKSVSYIAMFASSWGLLAGSLIIASPVIFMKIKDHVTLEEDLKFSDETIADVAPAAALESDGEKQGL